MNSQTAVEKLSRAVRYNNGKIATTQLEQIMISFIDPSQRALWSKLIKISLQAPEYADPIFSLRKIDNTYHQIVTLRDNTTNKIIWKLK